MFAKCQEICTGFKTHNLNFYNPVIRISYDVNIIVQQVRKISKQQNPYPLSLFNSDFPLHWCSIASVAATRRELLGSWLYFMRGFPGGANGKEPACQYRRWKRHGSDSWEDLKGIFPLRRAWQPTPVFLLGDSMDCGALWAIVHRITKGRIELK